MERRFSTIVAADMAGYSRLISANEENVINRLRHIRETLLLPRIRQGGGRVVKTTGDGLLLEFSGSADAVSAAIDIQQAMARTEIYQAPEDRIRFRVGINAGTVVVDGDDILGDAVNIAARLESLASPGGVCISRAVRDRIKDDQLVNLINFGPQFVKNIPTPVEVWGVRIDGVETTIPVHKPRDARTSVAVLAFDCQSDDPASRVFADGLAADVINQLSRFRSLLVIARSSSFSYRGSDKVLPLIGQELGARYIVQGSVRQAGPAIRVSAQLIQAETGEQHFTQDWDRLLTDIFALQDEMTQTIISALVPELGAHERQIARRKPISSLNAWETCQRGLAEFYNYGTKAYERCEALYRAAIDADAEFALPHALIARLYLSRVLTRRSTDPEVDLATGIGFAKRALLLDDRLEEAHIAYGGLLGAQGREAEARAVLARAKALNDNSVNLHLTIATTNLFSAEPDTFEMEQAAREGVRLNPKDPLAWAVQSMIGIALLWRNPNSPPVEAEKELLLACNFPDVDYYVVMLAAICAMRLDHTQKAIELCGRAMAKKTDLTLKSWAAPSPMLHRTKVVAASMPALQRFVDLGLLPAE